MSTKNCGVTRGYTYSYDENGEFVITLDRLNLGALPTVTVDLSNVVDTADLVALSVTAAKLANAVADQLITVIGTVPAESSNNIDVEIQAQDCQGNSLAANVEVQVWLADSGSALTPTATLPSAGAPTIQDSKGFILRPLAASVSGHYLTDSAGLLKLRFTETGALTRYLCVAIQGKLVMGNQALIWTS